MIKTTYRLREDAAFDEQGNKISVYGINAFSQKKIRSSYPDLFIDREKAESFVSLCNRSHLAPTHLPDVIEDLLSK